MEIRNVLYVENYGILGFGIWDLVMELEFVYFMNLGCMEMNFGIKDMEFGL